MATESPTVTATIDTQQKTIILSERLALYESRTVQILAASGDLWPVGDYTLAVTFHGSAVATAACTNYAGALSCVLNLNTTEMEGVFDAVRGSTIAFDVSLWDDTAHTLWGSARIYIARTNWTEATPAPNVEPEEYYTGATAITNGAATVTVDLSALSLTAAPQVVATVIGPAGAYNIFPTVTDVTATGFVASLSAAVPSSQYVLNWVVFP